jgi:hypothetical protein
MSKCKWEWNETIVIAPPQKWGVHHLKIDRGILDEARMHKHARQAYKIMIKIKVKLL